MKKKMIEKNDIVNGLLAYSVHPLETDHTEWLLLMLSERFWCFVYTCTREVFVPALTHATTVATQWHTHTRRHTSIVF